MVECVYNPSTLDEAGESENQGHLYYIESLRPYLKTKQKMLKLVLFSSFPTCFFFPSLLCLKDELCVTFFQSFLLTNLGKVTAGACAPVSSCV